jgi:hypothetical protein
MKLIINFIEAGQYGRVFDEAKNIKVKDKFKAIFSKKLKWDNKQGWYSKDKTEFVKATKKMETGQPVKFLVDVEEELVEKLEEFGRIFKVSVERVESFDEEKIVEVPDVKNEVVVIESSVILKRQIIRDYGLSKKFVDRWNKLLRKDDERLNKMIANPDLNIGIESIFEKNSDEKTEENIEDLFA